MKHNTLSLLGKQYIVLFIYILRNECNTTMVSHVSNITLTTTSIHGANFHVTSGVGGFYNDNLPSTQVTKT